MQFSVKILVMDVNNSEHILDDVVVELLMDDNEKLKLKTGSRNFKA